MNIFDAHITGSLSVSSSAEISGDLTVLGTINATISGTTTNAISASHAASYTLTSSFHQFTSSYTTGSFTGSFKGDGAELYNIPASGVTGLNLTQIADGVVTASVSNTDGLRVNSKTEITGSLTVTGQISGSFTGDGTNLYNVPASGVTGLNLTQISDGTVTASISQISGFTVNTNTTISGDLIVSGNVTFGDTSWGTPEDAIFTASIRTHNTTYLGDMNTTVGDALIVSGGVKVSGSQLITNDLIVSGNVYFGDTSWGTPEDVIFTSSIKTHNTTYLGDMNTTVGDALIVSGGVKISGTQVISNDLIVSGNVFFGDTTWGMIDDAIFTSSIKTHNVTYLGDMNTMYGDSLIVSGSVKINGHLSGSSLTGSIDYNNLTNVPTLVSGSSQIDITNTTNYTTFSSSISSSVGELSSSIATTDLNQNNRIDSLEGVSGSYATTGSNLFKGTQTHSGSIVPSVDNLYDLGSVTHQWRDVYISSGSLYIDGTKVISSTSQELTITTDNGQSLKILEGTTDSIVLQVADGDIELKSSGDGDILLDPTNGKIMLKGPVEVLSGQKIQSSVGGTPVVFANDIVVSGSIDITGTIEGINLTDFSSSVSGKLTSLEGMTGSLSSFTSSASSRLTSIETSTSSLNSFTSSATSRLTSIESSTSSLNTFTSSASGRLTSLEDKTGSYATTGSNIFQGNQTITGSLFISQDLVVKGSSSIVYVTSSQLRVDDNIITVNTASPASRFGGIEVHDSGSVGIATGSMLWDSINNRWIYQQSSESTYGGGMLLSGPRSSGSLGSELSLTNGKIARSAGGDHLNDSIITEYGGTTIGISGNLEISGSLVIPSTPLVSGSGQISFGGITGVPSGLVSGSSQVLLSSGIWSGSAQLPSGIVSGAAQLPSGIISGSSQLPSGLVSGSSQVDLTATTNYSTGIKTRLNAEGVISGSSQVDLTATTNYSTGIKTRLNAEGVISGSSQVLSGTGIWSGSAQLPLGVVSGSSQVLSGTGIWSGSAQLPSGVVSGSSQVLLSSGIWSGSAQLPSGVVSGSSQVLVGTTIHSGSFFNGISVVSGSSQISFNGIIDKPTLISGSSQITFGSISGIPGGLVSGSSQVLSGTGIWSGSAQLPSGVVSGSSQVTLSSTTGFGTYLNQAVLTTSTPTFSTVSATTFTGALSGNATTATYATNTTRLYASDGSYVYGGAAPYYMSMSYDGTRWLLQVNPATPSAVRVSYADTAGSATTAGALTSMNISQFTNNSGYITSYSETDTLGSVTNRGSSTSQNIVFSNGRKGLVGVYDAAQTQAIFAMGAAYILTDGGASSNIGNHYGLAWSYNPDYGGAGNNPQSKAGLNHQLLHMQAGVTTTAIGSGIWTSGGITCGTILPLSNGTLNLGSSSARWNTIFTSDLSLNNGIGDYTIVEGENDLFLYNNKQNKVYKFMLQEVNANDATPKRPE